MPSLKNAILRRRLKMLSPKNAMRRHRPKVPSFKNAKTRRPLACEKRGEVYSMSTTKIHRDLEGIERIRFITELLSRVIPPSIREGPKFKELQAGCDRLKTLSKKLYTLHPDIKELRKKRKGKH